MNGKVTGTGQAGARTPRIGWPVRSGEVPPLADCFSPRPESGFGLASSLAPGETAVLTDHDGAGNYPPAGLGGTGKTQLAAAFAHSLWHAGAVDLLAWVSASSRAAILSGYPQALRAAGAPGAGERADAAAARFLAWLADTSRSWLVVLDDLTDLADLDGLWPLGPAGRVLVTTRLPAAAVRGQQRKILQVGMFSRREALSYLTEKLSADPGQRTGALDLAEDLGCMPLALAQAGTLLADCGLDCREYRARFSERKRRMAVTGSGYPATVAVTWTLSLDRADFLPPAGLARPALALLTLLGPDGIPGAALTSRAACDYICGRHATGTAADQAQAVSSLRNLARVGLVTISPESTSRTVRMHALVQAAIQQIMPPGVLEQAASAAAGALLQAWPEGDAEPAAAQALRDCTASLHRVAADLLWAPEAHPVLLRAGQSLDSAGLAGPAIDYWQAVIDTSSRIAGPDHAQTLRACDNLAASYEAAGRTDDAIGAYEHCLAQREQARGPGHPEALTARASLARACLAAGRESNAIQHYERALADREWALGPGHPDTLTTRGDLAAAYRAAGRLPDAITAFQRTLTDRQSVLGPDHPETLAARAGLASALHTAGRLKEALPQYERTLAGRERVQGTSHPDTMTARASLAYAFRSAGRLKHALPLYQRTLSDRERVLGPDHPDTLAARGNLASAYHTARRLNDAIPLYEQALADRERVQGADHPDTLAARGNLASAYHSAGRVVLAIPLYEQTLADYERTMGPRPTRTP